MPSKKRYWKYKNKGICTQCQKPVMEGSIYCSECRKKQNKRFLENKERRRNENRCPDCGRKMLDDGYDFKTCPVCRSMLNRSFIWS
jgi:predicted amidophosphoribosyltransferase